MRSATKGVRFAFLFFFLLLSEAAASRPGAFGAIAYRVRPASQISIEIFKYILLSSNILFYKIRKCELHDINDEVNGVVKKGFVTLQGHDVPVSICLGSDLKFCF